MPNDVLYSATQYGLWMNSNTAVPLSSLHPSEVLEYYISDSKSNLVISTPAYEERLRPLAEKLNKRIVILDHDQIFTNDDSEVKLPKSDTQFNAMILYTSGTTNKPKGVVISYDNIESQISCLENAWQIRENDTILHTLPLHHVHGVINALLLPLYVGGKVIMLPKYETESVWKYLLNIGLPQKDRVSCFMAVPTIYNYLIAEYDKIFKSNPQMSEYIKNHCSSKIRLMISGSSPLPQTVFKRWQEITGHKLLERYGMTEIGMAVSNPLIETPTNVRLPGFVGQPLPGVDIRITQNEKIVLEAHGESDKGFWSKPDADIPLNIKIAPNTLDETGAVSGSLEVKSNNVFTEYFNKPEATKKEFTSDGWFKTGDSIAYDDKLKSFKILGRDSVDIIKSRGYKISALEIETKLLENEIVKDVAVIGVPDELYGQKIVALIVPKDEKVIEDQETTKTAVENLNLWNKDKFSSYSLPSVVFTPKITRNHMGKVNKVDLLRQFLSNTNTDNESSQK